MTDQIVTAIVSGSAAVIVGVAALVVNAVWMGRAFAGLGTRIDDLNKGLSARMDDMNRRVDRVDKRLETIETTLASYVLDVAMIKGRLGL